MTIAAIILNYGEPDETINCISSLLSLEIPALDIYIVDNGSPDESVAQLKNSTLPFILVETSENRGFAGGMNVGIDAALRDGADYIWLLNNDISFPDDFDIDPLVELASQAEIGAVSPLIREPNGDIWFSQGELEWDRVNARNADEPLTDTVDTPHMPLAAAFIDANLLRDIPLPAGYFMYWEDVEWGAKVWESGRRLVTTPEAEVIHDAGASSNMALKSYYSARNRWIFYRQFKDRCASFHIPYLWLMIKLTVGRALDLDFKAMVALWEGVTDGALGRTGPGRYP